MMKAPTIAELLADPVVLQALEKAWLDSLPEDPHHRHEEGGWIYLDMTTLEYAIRRAIGTGQASVDLNSPPILPKSVIVATFHTHPNPISEGWESGPSASDTTSARLLGVPCLIRAEDGYHSTGPDSRRGGLTGVPGFPL